MSLLIGASLLATVAPPWMFAVLIIGGVATVLLISTPVEYFRRHGPVVRSVEMALDDGGLRLYIQGTPHYVPLSELEVELNEAHAPRSIVVPGPLRRLTVDLASDDRERAPAFVAAIDERRKRAMATPADLAPLMRRSESLEAWSARALALVQDARRATGYRATTELDDETLRSIVIDPARDSELRAGAGFALVRVAPGHAIDVRRACEGGAPPIVVAMCFAGAGAELRPAFAAIADLLPRADRRAAERLAATAPATPAPGHHLPWS